MTSRTAFRAAVLGCALLLGACATHHAHARVGIPRAQPNARPPVPAHVRIGRSVRGHPIYATEAGKLHRARADLLVVGCIHGDEPAGTAVTRLIRTQVARQPLDAWLVGDLNPDGRASHTRQNARGVDLNRNFPWRWRPLGPPGTQQYSGRGPLSEPESRAAYTLIKRLRPRLTIWFHQPLGVVDESGGNIAVERRFSRLAHLPLRRLPRYPGSAVGWENHEVAGSTAFVVELPPGPIAAARAKTLAAAVIALASAPRGG